MPRSNRTRGLPRQERREYAVPDTEEARKHAEDAAILREELKEFGVAPEMVAPTRDGSGHVRLNFEQMGKLIDHIYDLEDKVEELQNQLGTRASTSNSG